MDLLKVDEFRRIATKPQWNLLMQITEYAEQEERIVNRIGGTRVAARIGRGTVSALGGLGVTVCEDDDDLRAIHGRDYTELERIRGEMKSCFLRAVELGMANVGIIARQYPNYVGKPLPQP